MPVPSSSLSVPPLGGVPTGGATYPGVVPTNPVITPPLYTPPLYTPPVVVPTTTTTPTPTPTTQGPSPAPKCTGGPSAQQLIAVVEGTPGIPDEPLKVTTGPFCSGNWQFSVMEIVADDAEDEYEPLAVVTTGLPAALKLIEAGADVCSNEVQTQAPIGIRVRACGA
ncbi:hypothetical protein [Winogradskya humida]|uniref:hypothetical protein n=1 Tax=Winogradskya humida TaxID=113566 RepID=UPI00194185FF|nr:hypothetical protein [Actinoplanes humidus]